MMSKFIMKIVCYFKKHFVTRIRNFVFTYRKSIERKCPVTNIYLLIILRYKSSPYMYNKKLKVNNFIMCDDIFFKQIKKSCKMNDDELINKLQNTLNKL